MAITTINETTLTNIADAIRTKKGTAETYKPGEMPEAILTISGSDLPSSFTGDCSYLFANPQTATTLLNQDLTFNDVSSLNYTFYNNSNVEDLSHIVIPLLQSKLALNTINGYSLKASYAFANCYALKSFPQLTRANENYKIYFSDVSSMFSYCRNMRELPSWLNKDSVGLYSLGSGRMGAKSADMLSGCFSLRHIDSELLPILCAGTVENGDYYVLSGAAVSPITRGGFNQCYALDELINVPTYSMYDLQLFNSYFVRWCHRLSRLTFYNYNNYTSLVNEVLDLSDQVGWTDYTSDILNHNSGITADKEVTNSATYNALKNDPDWFTTKVAYSRYNRTSAVETINSLPNTSSYVTAQGGTNTIKFKGSAGSATDGGAINTMTAEEIAVATAKGWTVTFV